VFSTREKDTTMSTNTIQKGTYGITFIADGFCLTTNHFGYSEQDAMENAIRYMKEHYGYDMTYVSNDIDIEFLD
jgi:hypothetical protein